MNLLSALTALEICTIIVFAAVVVTFIWLACLLIRYKKQKTEKPEQKSTSYQPQQQGPIVIYERKPVNVEKKVVVEKQVVVEKEIVYVPAPAPVEEEEVEEIPTVEKEIAMAEVAAKAPIVEDDSENAMRYNRSFRARLIQAEDEVKEWYGVLKNGILSYDRVTSRISWKNESFSYRRNSVAKLFIKGKTLYLYLALNPADYADSKYKLEDVSKISQFAETPALYKLKSEKRIRYALDLIDEICTKLGSKKLEREPVDYYEPYNSDVALIKKGLVKRVIEDASKSFIGATGYSKAQDKDTDFNSKK